jgi:hypothetical protein
MSLVDIIRMDEEIEIKLQLLEVINQTHYSLIS